VGLVSAGRHEKPAWQYRWAGTPENGFIERAWDGYNEGKMVYILALGSGRHPAKGRQLERLDRAPMSVFLARGG